MSEVEQLISVKNRLGEGPVWINGVLYWVDIGGKAFYHYHPSSRDLHRVETKHTVTFLSFADDNLRIVGTDEGLGVWENGEIRILEDNVAYQPADRFNDAATCPRGRLWAGTMGDKATNHLFCMDLDGSVRIAQDGVGISNGIGWSPDGTTMYHTDSMKNTIYAYRYDLDAGTIHDRRVFFQSPEGFGTPDGLTVDSAGFVWSGFWDGWKIARINPDGDVVRVVAMPVQRPTSCTFGGADLDELFITSAIDDLNADDLQSQPLAGDVFRLKVDVPGRPENRLQIKV